MGANLALIVMVCPAETVTGRLGLISEKYLVEIAALLMVMLWASELVAVIVRVLLLPTRTDPKLTYPPLPNVRLPVGG